MNTHRTSSDHGSALLNTVLVIVVLAILGGVGYLVYRDTQSSSSSPTTTAPPASTTSSSPTTAPSSSSGYSPNYWLISAKAASALQHNGMSAAELSYYIDNPHGLVISPGSGGVSAVARSVQSFPDATQVQSFSSYAVMQSAFANGQISPSTKYILYDNEHWQATPPNEQADPIGYEQMAAQLVHQHGLKLIFTPAENLAQVLNGTGRRGDKYTAYLNLGIPSQGAKYADIYEIQSQQIVGNPEFATFVSGAVDQVHAANPDCIVLAGLTTNDAVQTMTLQGLQDAYSSTNSMVDGYWMNIPGGSSGTPDPQLAVSFFNSLYPQQH